MKHTPGPWKAQFHTIQDGNGGGQFCLISSHDETPILKMFSWSSENKANAQLIAAAPDLLQTLVHVMEHLKAYAGDNSVLNERSALYYSVGKTIAKASGL